MRAREPAPPQPHASLSGESYPELEGFPGAQVNPPATQQQATRFHGFSAEPGKLVALQARTGLQVG
jgi:hypothetical protein